jgi:hypothetical protein
LLHKLHGQHIEKGESSNLCVAPQDGATFRFEGSSAGDDMRFDEAFDILVEHCARVSPGL